MADEYTEPRAPSTRSGEGMMKRDEVNAALKPILQDSFDFVDSVLSPEREKATRYYNGEPFGNEEEGRSQIVLTEVRDTISGITPDLLRIFFGPERVVEFLPKTADRAVGARDATDYVHYNFAERNNGFLETLAVLKDGLIRKIGVFKSWWDDTNVVRASTLTNVTSDELFQLAAAPDTKLLGVKQTEEGTYTVHLTRATKGRIRVKALPPEEFIYNRSAVDSESQFILLAHRTQKTRGELLSLGISEKVLEEHGGISLALNTNPETIARQPDHSTPIQDESTDDANKLHDYTEAYMHLDVDGDGVAELRQICVLGPGNYVTNGKGLGVPVDEHPFALFIPDPEPHSLHGSSWYDRTGDLQLLKSSVMRAQLDSLAASIFGRMAYVEGQANVADILNTEIGAPIRMRSQNAVQAFNIPFSGEVATPILQYLDTVVERRTGRSKGAEGLDMDALQSTTDEGVSAALAGSRAQTEMLARIFAEMTLKPLFRRMYRLLQQNQPKEAVRLRDRVVEIDPSSWGDELDVSVNVALGSTMVEKKLAHLGNIVAKQEQIIQLMGPTNPICDIPMYAATLQRGVELGGFRDVESFFKTVQPNWQEQQPKQPEQPNPEMVLVQIEQAKAQAQAQLDAAKHQQAQAEAQAKMDLEDRKLQQEYVIEQQKMQLQLELERMKLEMNAQVEQAKLAISQAGEQAKLEAENMRESARIETDDARQRDEMQLTHDRETASLHLEHEREREATAHKAAQSERDSARKHEESKAKAKESAKPAQPAAPAFPAEIVLKRGRAKVVRDEKGKITGIEDAE